MHNEEWIYYVYIVEDYSALYNNAVHPLYVRVGILSLRGGWAYKTSSTPPLLSACTKPGKCHVFVC